MWWKTNKGKLLVLVLAVAVLAGVFYYGGNFPGSRDWNIARRPAPISESGDGGSNITAPETTPAGEAGVNSGPAPSPGSAPADQAEGKEAEPMPGGGLDNQGLKGQAAGTQEPGTQGSSSQKSGDQGPGGRGTSSQAPESQELSSQAPESQGPGNQGPGRQGVWYRKSGRSDSRPRA